MLTPRDIEKKSFSHTRNNGYKTEEVEDFLEEIIADYSMLIEERENLSNRVLSLSDKLENIRDEQEVWKKTLMNTQKSYDEIIDSAKEKADAIIKEATAKAESITSAAAADAIEIKSKINDLTAHKNALAAEVERFKNGLLASYEAHIKIIQTIPTISKEELAKTVDIEIPHISAVEKNISDTAETEQNDATADTETETADQEDVKQEETKPLDATMVIPPIKTQESEEETVAVTHTRLRQPIEADQADDDDDILVSRSSRTARPRTEPARQNNNEISSREEKLRNLFADEPAEKQKPKKTKRKLSRFFVDDDEIDDEDFDDED